ncbi:MAG: glycolate oxidase subunit GlcF [Rhodospirillales bacterium]
MRTEFSADLLRRPEIAELDTILRKCVHCGFCLTACPTYAETGDERDSPRGRIYLIKDMIETGRTPSAAVASHVDRCLGCLACQTACPSGVDYERYIDIGRAHLETVHRRPLGDKILRAIVSAVLPHARRAGWLFKLGRLARPFIAILGGRLAAMAERIPAARRRGNIYDRKQTFTPEGAARMRVVLAPGCVQQTLRPSINDASVRLLTRLGAEVVIAGDGAGCCGALDHHIGRDAKARNFARANMAAWMRRDGEKTFDYIVTNAAGCGTQIKGYGRLLAGEDEAVNQAADMAARARDITQVLAEMGLPAIAKKSLPQVIYHDACSLMHGQGVTQPPRQLLLDAGFRLREIPGKHFCCGSAGSYNLMQPEMAGQLLQRRLGAIGDLGDLDAGQEKTVIATGNIGCIEQLASGTHIPVVHTVELLDWATGGPRPPGLEDGP